MNGCKMEKSIIKGCPRVSCYGTGYWNIQYRTLLNMRYTNQYKTVAFAEHMVIMIKAESIREAENIANVELSRISTWAKQSKIRFNEKIKSNAYNKTKAKRTKELEKYTNNKPLFKCTV
jgi:hypothetical protein